MGFLKKGGWKKGCFWNSACRLPTPPLFLVGLGKPGMIWGTIHVSHRKLKKTASGSEDFLCFHTKLGGRAGIQGVQGEWIYRTKVWWGSGILENLIVGVLESCRICHGEFLEFPGIRNSLENSLEFPENSRIPNEYSIWSIFFEFISLNSREFPQNSSSREFPQNSDSREVRIPWNQFEIPNSGIRSWTPKWFWCRGLCRTAGACCFELTQQCCFPTKCTFCNINDVSDCFASIIECLLTLTFWIVRSAH